MDFMSKLETNALRIIELLYPDIDINGIEKYKEFFSSYQGLMPIVFECNSGANNTAIKILDKKVIFGEYDFMNEFDVTRGIAYSTEPLFINAIQLACIKYLELKNEH